MAPTKKLPQPEKGAGPSAARADFARLQLDPAMWVVHAEDPFDYQFGRTYRRFHITFDRAQAPVFVSERALEIQAGLRRLFPRVALDPATFDEFIEQQAEPPST